MSLLTTRPDWTCATCRITFAHRPTFHVGLAFCCAGCAADGPCVCSYDEVDTTVRDAEVADWSGGDAGALVANR